MQMWEWQQQAECSFPHCHQQLCYPTSLLNPLHTNTQFLIPSEQFLLGTRKIRVPLSANTKTNKILPRSFPIHHKIERSFTKHIIHSRKIIKFQHSKRPTLHCPSAKTAGFQTIGKSEGSESIGMMMQWDLKYITTSLSLMALSCLCIWRYVCRLNRWMSAVGRW